MPERPGLGGCLSGVRPLTPTTNHVTSSVRGVTFLFGTLYLSTLLSLTLCIGVGPPAETTTALVCPSRDEACEKDRFGYEAVRQLHGQIDDDHNGNLDRTESDEFMRDELKYEEGFDRGVNFHGTDDLISVQDLWLLWIHSDVYNWTVDDVVDWVIECVELPQYTEIFRINAVDGKALPRLAANGQYLTNILGIKNAVNKQKLAVKAMDAVLFGAPKLRHSYLKDVALVASLVIAVGGCWLAYLQHRYSQKHLSKVMKDLDTLQKAEDALTDVQFKLDKAQEEQESVVKEKKHLESKLKAEIDTAKGQAERLRHTREATEEEISRLKLAEEELVQVRRALRRAEKELEDRQNAPLAELQQWLQLTYELECRHYDAKREGAEAQLVQCKEMCEKIRRKRGAFLGSIRIAHTTSMDDTDGKILRAKAALEEIKTDLQERSHRWQQVEQICGFNIVHNPGLHYLESTLGRSDSGTGRPLLGSMISPVEDTDDESPTSSLNASAPLQPVGPPGIDKRPPSLLRAFGSSNSLQTMIPQQAVNDYQTSLQPVISCELDAEVEEINSKVTVTLGPATPTSNSSTLTSDSAEDLRQRSRSFGKSQSLEVKPAVRPKGFPSSVSMPVIPAEGIPSEKKSETKQLVGTPTISASASTGGHESSPESMDSISLEGDPHKEKKKKKKHLFSKLTGSRKEKLKES